jgi:hypothetical protein
VHPHKTSVVSGRHDAIEVMAKDGVPVVAKRPAVHDALKDADSRPHGKRPLSHLDGRQAVIVKALHGQAGKVRIESDFAHVEAGAKLTNLLLDFFKLDDRAVDCGNQAIIAPLLIRNAIADCTGA